MIENGISYQEIKSAGALVSYFIAGVTGVLGAVFWFQNQLKATRVELYRKINRNHEETTASKERVSLLEQAHSHHESRMDGMDVKMDTMQKDITTIKENFSQLSQKQSENHLNIVGEIRGIGDKITINRLKGN